MKYTTKKIITLPLSKWTADEEKVLLIESEIFVGKAVQKPVGGKKMDPAHLMNCIDLETGEACQVIVGKVLHSILDEEYPDASYVGKAFAITQQKSQGKSYKTYRVVEIEVESVEVDKAF